MPTIRDLILKSILIFLLCQHAVNAADKWPSEAEQVFYERFDELGTRTDLELVRYVRFSHTMKRLNLNVAATATLRSTLLEGEAREKPTLRHLMEERERLRAELDEWKTTWRQLQADGEANYAEFEGAIRSHVSLPAQKDSDEDGAEPQRQAANATNYGSLADQYSDKCTDIMEELNKKLKNLKKPTLYNLTENEIQESAKEVIAHLSNAKAALRQYYAVCIDVLEFCFGRNEIAEFVRTLELMLREKEAETKTALAEKEEMKRALEAKEAETTTALEAREAALQSNQHKLSEVEEEKAALEREVGEHGGLSWPMYLLLALAVVLLMLLFVLVVLSIRSRRTGRASPRRFRQPNRT